MSFSFFRSSGEIFGLFRKASDTAEIETFAASAISRMLTLYVGGLVRSEPGGREALCLLAAWDDMAD